MASGFDGARRVLTDAIAARAFPAAVIEVGDATRVAWREPFGRLSYAPDSIPAEEDTVFDLASLTKVLATAMLVMEQVERGVLGWDDPVRAHVPGWRHADRQDVSLRDLLAHCSGLPAHAPYFERLRGADLVEAAICATGLAYPPRSASVYSDLGFMLLGFVLARDATLPDRFDAVRHRIDPGAEIQFGVPERWIPRTAPTEHDPWRGRLLVGEVHDENAFVLGGAAGHAGLFGTAPAVGSMARHLLQILAGRQGVVRRETLLTCITRRADVPGSSRALAWDTMLPTSSCGTAMSTRAFGHTGFTGTSLWIDPDAGIYVVLLTNRVHPTRANDAIGGVRRAVHDAVMRDAAEGAVRG